MHQELFWLHPSYQQCCTISPNLFFFGFSPLRLSTVIFCTVCSGCINHISNSNVAPSHQMPGWTWLIDQEVKYAMWCQPMCNVAIHQNPIIPPKTFLHSHILCHQNCIRIDQCTCVRIWKCDQPTSIVAKSVFCLREPVFWGRIFLIWRRNFPNME